MANNGTKKNKLGRAEGFSAGLKFWLFFLVSFSFLGYPVPLSIFLGAIGGLAGGWIVAWAKSKDDDIPIATVNSEQESKQISQTPQGGKRKYSKKKSRSQSAFAWLFGGKQNASKPRRMNSKQ